MIVKITGHAKFPGRITQKEYSNSLNRLIFQKNHYHHYKLRIRGAAKYIAGVPQVIFNFETQKLSKSKSLVTYTSLNYERL